MSDEQLDDGDHLAALCMAGAAASFGSYTPERVTLSLSGTDEATDRVVYIHEAHHSALNDSTAWGTALLVFAALGAPQRSCFRPFLDACRLPHEAYATFAAVNIASAYHRDAEAVLEHYPQYSRLFEALAAVVTSAAGPHRRYLAATAMARVCMQTPILTAMSAQATLAVPLSEVRTIDTPNGRWRWLMRQSAPVGALAIKTADETVRARYGPAPIALDDGAMVAAVADDELDAVWESWERAAYEAFADALASKGATTLEFNGHMELTAQVLERARTLSENLSLTAARVGSPAPDDRALSASTIEHVRLTLAEPREAILAAFEVGELVSRVEERQRIDGVPSLVVSARLPRRLLESYRWDGAGAGHLARASAPVVAIPLIAAHETASTLIFSPLDEPGQLDQILAEWGTRGPTLTIAAASCFADSDWAGRWSPTLRRADAMIMLVDVQAERFVRSWVSAGVPAHAATIRVQDTKGVLWATGMQVGDDTALWLHIGDEMTVKLMRDQLRRTPGLDLHEESSRLDSWSQLLPIAITHLLATETFLDLQGLDQATIRRITNRLDVE